MKRSVILVVPILILPLVEALTIFGEEISMLVLIPSIFILVILVVFVSIIIRDKIKSKHPDTNLNLGDIPEPGSPEEMTKGPPLIEKSFLEEPASKAPEPMQKQKIDYLKEVEILEKSPLTNTIELNKRLNKLVRSFFSDYLGINPNFTFEELEKELRRGNKKIICFSNNLSSVNYSPEDISKEDLTELIKEFKDILLSSLQDNQPFFPEFRKEVEEKKKEIILLIKKGGKLIKKDMGKAKEEYINISKLYKTLPDEDKEAIRPPIMDLYNKLQL